MGESRNQRRSRRRRETRDDRDALRLEKLKKECSHAPVVVFHHWEMSSTRRRLCGYIYNDVRFANGSYIHTGEVIRNVCHGELVWFVTTPRSTYNVKNMTANWIQVGAGHAYNRLKYKLWPKLVILALLFRARRRLYAPDGLGFQEAMAHFMTLTFDDNTVDSA